MLTDRPTCRWTLHLCLELIVTDPVRCPTLVDAKLIGLDVEDCQVGDIVVTDDDVYVGRAVEEQFAIPGPLVLHRSGSVRHCECRQS